MTGQGSEGPPEAPPKRPPVSAATLRHVYVAGAALIAIVALLAAARNGSSSSGGKRTAVPKERTAQYYKRLVSIGRGLSATPIGEAVLPALHGTSTLGDGTHFSLVTDKATKTTFVKVTILPGASIPWHHHSSPFVIALISGKVLDYRPDRPGCAGKALEAGNTVFEPNTQIHTLTNPFKVPAVFYVLAFSPAKVDPTLIEVKTPHGCSPHPK